MDLEKLQRNYSLSSLASTETLSELVEPGLKLAQSWLAIRLFITVFLLAWGIALSVSFKFGDARTRAEMEFYDNIFLGYKHSGIFTIIAKLWILTLLAVTIYKALPIKYKKKVSVLF